MGDWTIRRLSVATCGAIIAVALFAPGHPSLATTFGIGSNTRVEVPLKSLKDLRDHRLVRQRFDYSCGAAALATLLWYGFGHQVTEREVLRDVFQPLIGDEEDLRKEEGLSLLDLQRVAQARGFRAQGFRLPPEYLPQLGGPVIVFIKPRGYEHFAVLRGVRGDRVYLADPSRGNIRIPVYTFLDTWLGEDGKGIIFVAEPENGGGDSGLALEAIVDGVPRPEILSARQLLEVGNPFARFPHLGRQ